MSDWYQLDNRYMSVQVTSKGAEMKRLFAKNWRHELLWQPSDEESKKLWNRSAPVLFPIVGKLKNDRYTFKGKEYQMPQHGFARDSEFKCVLCTDDTVKFKLEATAETFKMYPFCFELYVSYELKETKLTISYTVVNADRQDIFFSLGAHPGFSIRDLEDYEIHFESREKKFYRLDQWGCVDWTKSYPFEGEILKISDKLFLKDALIFKEMKSKYIDIIDLGHQSRMRLHRGESPYFGIWGKGHVPFVCLEPWWGVADGHDHDGDLEKKLGIIKLLEGKSATFTYKIELL